MKATWVRPGGPLFPDQDKAKRISLEQFFWDATDSQINSHILDLMRQAAWKVGLTRDPAWDGYSLTPEDWAKKLSSDITRLGCDGKQCSVIMDIEVHDSDWVLRAIKGFRVPRPNRFVYWTLEPLQGGIISDVLVAYINSDPNLWIVPQKYRGNMAPVSEQACINDLRARGIAESKILTYYDRYEEHFNGILFDWANVVA